MEKNAVRFHSKRASLCLWIVGCLHLAGGFRSLARLMEATKAVQTGLDNEAIVQAGLTSTWPAIQIALVAVINAALCVISGLGFRRGREWGYFAALVVALINLPTAYFPLSCAVLWFLIPIDKQTKFNDFIKQEYASLKKADAGSKQD